MAAANSFASFLHKNCHKIIVILVYALLEWILILLLLLNSSFSFLIAKFANFFGLKPSCTWCSRLGHNKIGNSDFDHVCEAHGAEISRLSYCSSHKKLAESKNLCGNCSSSTVNEYGPASSTVAFFAWMCEGVSENGEEKRCSCCGEISSRKDNAHAPPLIFKPSWDVLDYMRNRSSLDPMKHKMESEEKGREDDSNSDHQRASEEDDHGCKKGETAEESACDSSRKSESFEVQEWNSGQNDDPFGSVGCNEDDESVYLADMLLRNADYTDSDKFICIELIDTPSVSSQDPLTKSSQDAEVGGVEEADSFPESGEIKDYAMSEPVGGILPQSSSDSEFFVINSSIIGISEEQEMDQGVEDCLDGSSISGKEVSEDCLSREDLLNMIKAQEKALKALYSELEEERRSAEEAAMETMAMITKVQEEKAAIQIEALQYQRMMEEQAEYDQEALQLLNDLMMKREKEKKELEKELEFYRNRAMDDDAAEEKMMIRRRNSTGESNYGAYTDAEGEDEGKDGDDSQFGANEERELDDCSEEECAGDSAKPDVTLAEFDEERLSILEEVKLLEGKLLALSSDDHERESDQEREAMDKVGHVYERLQALEEDKDFLEHCIRSMMKGNKGVDLLREILQHLRDLKSVELSGTNMAEVRSSEAAEIVEDEEWDRGK